MNICETPRLLLRQIVDEDAEALMKVLGDAEVMKFSVRGAETHEGVLKFIAATRRRYVTDGVAQWAVIMKSDGVFVGECGISLQDIEGKKQYEIGYRFARRFWGLGLATEAAVACREYGFGEKKLNRLISIIEVENRRSIRVAEKVGMRFEKDAVFHQIQVAIYSIANNI